ncbi:cidABC operon transcriptional activator CidR [Pseudalkalibacillus caeni]|uniref:LysR family transcriptional regulator n=1 Tax=Exobacillus caeni TaxID=2574798 RepID=A0A5R9F405_9BACL|nr:LysR family transcriptional regulator [Pseudalkalibacillus caeni]TLS35194.1 LysR family transcriptional regulator [Pseudalkalibacillus caeni]
MDIKHLQYFIEVTKLKSFSKAAEHLFITQPTISKMIRNLEDELGVPLFDRTKKTVELTDAGRIIFDQATVIDKAFKDLRFQLDNLLELKKGSIRIGLPPMIGSLYFPDIIGRFHEHYPDISIQLVEYGSKRIEDEIDKGDLDLGVVVLPVNNSVFHSFSFEKENIQLVIPSSHRFASLSSIDLESLKDENFILFNEDFALHNRIISSCAMAGFQPNIISESSQWDFIGKMVSSRLGVALMPESICKDLTSDVSVLNVTSPSIYWELAIIWRKNKYLSYAAKEWLTFTQEQLNKKYRR